MNFLSDIRFAVAPKTFDYYYFLNNFFIRKLFVGGKLLNQRVFITVAIIVLAFATPSVAMTIKHTFTGSVTQVGSAALSGVSAGDTVTGVLSYDVNEAPSSSNTNAAFYSNFSFIVSTGRLTGAPAPSVIRVINDLVLSGGGTVDLFVVGNGLENTSFLELRDRTNSTAFSDTSLPQTFDLSKFDRAEMGISFSGVSRDMVAEITGVQTEVMDAAVPLPASVLLLMGGLGGLVALRRRKAQV